MFPEIIMHNTISLDGAINGFGIDLELHYQILSSFNPDATLVGSVTAKTGIDIFIEEIPPEENSDFIKPQIKSNACTSFCNPYWIIVDTSGILEGLLHVLRRSEYCKDIILLVSEKTPLSYINYLRERNYEYVVTGEKYVDYKKALEICTKRYGFKKIVMDSGSTLCDIMLDEGLIDKINLIIAPVIVGADNENIFGKVAKSGQKLKMLNHEVIKEDFLHVQYKVMK
ncbi:RibD family protein [uncultured Methanolobus sp.]|uniref:RibD family protein n=1 Tax=uncultured Methanolobus sp. TaxID=218300 RepID=UPI0029C68629|nr:RibD family protein [uncultured Methanolobus sp.]